MIPHPCLINVIVLVVDPQHQGPFPPPLLEGGRGFIEVQLGAYGFGAIGKLTIEALEDAWMEAIGIGQRG